MGPDGALGRELSRPKRVSWLPAYVMMWAMSLPVSCGGVKTHVFMDDSYAYRLFSCGGGCRPCLHGRFSRRLRDFRGWEQLTPWFPVIIYHV